MRQRPRIERLWQRDLNPVKWPLWAALVPFSLLYSAALALRSPRIEHATLPIISVGNLTVGGNAKTPFTLYLARLLQFQGYHIGIASRGYGRVHPGARLVADDGKLLLDVAESGDEPAMMAYRFDGPIAVASRRLDAIRLLAKHRRLDAIILDDGFQHRRLHRDLDLVVVNTRSGFGNGWLLPAGPLRESVKALKRADVIVLIADNNGPTNVEPRAFSGQPRFDAALRPSSLVQSSKAGWIEHPLLLEGRNVVAVSGLANRDGFTAMLTRLGAHIVESFAFRDHHRYSGLDWSTIHAAARHADLVITTEKDLVKLQAFSPACASLYALRIDVSLEPKAQAELLGRVKKVVEQFHSTSP